MIPDELDYVAHLVCSNSRNSMRSVVHFLSLLSYSYWVLTLIPKDKAQYYGTLLQV